MKARRYLIMLSLIAASAWLMGNGLYIKAKAQVADWMISNTWEERQPDGAPQKPWPWADTWVVARIEVPRLGKKQYVMQDASGESLAFGLGAVIPVSGHGYNFISGHRDTHFDYLDQLIIGDTVTIETYPGQRLTYQITATAVIDTRNGPLTVDQNNPGLSLITCWPMDSIVPGGPLRYVVSGVLTERTLAGI